MIFRTTGIAGLVRIELQPTGDDRGTFTRTFDAELWAAQGLGLPVAQCSLSRNPSAGTLRGLHYQADPHGEHKLVRCSRGAIFDVAVDLRRDSPTFCDWRGFELSEANGSMLHISPGIAHGFLTLTPAAELVYQMSEPHRVTHARGVRWDDPAFGISWPRVPSLISDRDRSYPDFVR